MLDTANTDTDHQGEPSDRSGDIGANDIAIVGMSGRFPGCADIDGLWRALRAGESCIQRFTTEELIAAGFDANAAAEPNFVNAGGLIDKMAYFDAGFFGFSPKDAAVMDPQHRIFLECCWEAFETAGIVPRQFKGPIGVFAGCGPNNYFMRNVMSNQELVRSTGHFLLRHTGNDRDFLPTGVSYRLDLHGPSMAVQTACSTSLVAVHVACQSLLNGECDMALAGGITADEAHGHGYVYHENEIESPDGVCRPFDAASAGTVLTSGAGVVLLRRLEDAIADGDIIHAVIKGSAVNNDGARKVGYLAPSVDGHAEAVVEALGVAGLTAEDISYVETHGTGTAVGDPIEIAALTAAFRQSTSKSGYCPIGSLKATIGHTDTAAGICGLIKIVEALKHREIPASINYTAPNPRIDFTSSPFYVNQKLMPWAPPAGRRYAGLSSLGVGGTNAHVIVGEAPSRRAQSVQRPIECLALSAKSPTALNEMTRALARHLERNPGISLGDVAHTLQTGRDAFEHRRVVVASSAADAVRVIDGKVDAAIASARATSNDVPVVFMFPGGGSQYVDMGRGLYDSEPVFRSAIDECARLVRSVNGTDLKTAMYPDAGSRDGADARLAACTPALLSIFATSYATAKLWMSRGIEPAAMTGHSLGEYVAACLAGVLSLADAIKVVAARARVMEQARGTSMLTVPLPEAEVRELLGSAFDLAAVNGPQLCLVSGPTALIDDLSQSLKARDVECRKLHLDAASHCRQIEPFLPAFRVTLNEVKWRAPQRRYVSNVTGRWAGPEVATADFWVRHFRGTVLFDAGLKEILQGGECVLLEVGPGTTLSSLARQQPRKPRGIIASLRHPSDTVSDLHAFALAAGRIWASGGVFDWVKARGGAPGRRIALPTYAFQRQRYWLDAKRMGDGQVSPKATARITKQANPDDWFYRLGWTAERIGRDQTAEKARFLVIEDAAGLGVDVAARLRASGHDVIVVKERDSYLKMSDDAYAFPAEQAEVGFAQMMADLVAGKRLPQRIVHMWMVTTGTTFRPGSNFFHRNQEHGYYSLVALAKALATIDDLPAIHIDVVSNGMQAVGAETVRFPDKATLLGPVRVIPREMPGVSVRSIDLDLGADPAAGSIGPAALSVHADHILDEVLGPSRCEIVAYRKGLRMREQIERSTEPKSTGSQTKPVLRKGGVYLVTGGLGGIGLKLAEHLAANWQASLVLMSRAALPDRSAWSAWSKAHGAGNDVVRRIRAIEHIETIGGKVVTAAGDVGNIENIRDAIATAKARFGRIDGVFHAAAVLDDGAILAKSTEQMERVLDPKVHGTLMLAKALVAEAIDFVVLFGSTSALIGPAGQVDYTAANCFLNAVAQSDIGRAAKFRVVDWGVWKDVGAGRAAAQRLVPNQSAGSADGSGTAVQLVAGIAGTGAESFVDTLTLRVADQWVLDEHRTTDGQAIMPGSGYLDLVCARFQSAAKVTRMGLRSLSFLAPIAVADDETRQVRLAFRREAASWAFDVASRRLGDATWQTNATGLLDLGQPIGEACARDLPRVAMPEAWGQGPAYRQQEFLSFGPRWDVIKATSFKDHEGWALLELDERFESDLATRPLHPALLDIATGFALSLVPGYLQAPTPYVPMMYETVEVLAPLPRRVVSHIIYKPEASADGLATFQVSLADETGRLLVSIARFTVRRLEAGARFGAAADGIRRAPGSALSRGETLFLETVDCGILAEEGMMALERVLQSPDHGPIVVSSVDLPLLIQSAGDLALAASGPRLGFDRPDSEQEYVAPRTAIEKRLAAFWQDQLGISKVGVNDDFFELGGHSLIAVRLVSRVKKEWSVEYPISVLFQAPTVARFAEILGRDAGIDDGARAADIKVGRDAKPASRHLVAMTKVRNDGRPPFYLVAGMFGNVLNLRHLARHLGDEFTVYALQARGLYGDDKPHYRFEDMAADYIAEIRAIQPTGPYFLGGFSGGGIVAYEMAQQLERQGETIGSLIMLDTRVPVPPKADLREKVQVEVLRLLRSGWRYPIDWILRRRRIEDRRRADEGLELTSAEFRSDEIGAAFDKACQDYEIAPYHGRVDLFRPPMPICYELGRGRQLNEHREHLDLLNHWGPHIPGGVVVHNVSGDHDAMVLEPYVRVLAAGMKVRLRNAMAEAGVAVRCAGTAVVGSRPVGVSRDAAAPVPF